MRHNEGTRFNRRDFLRLTAGATAAVAISSLPGVSYAQLRKTKPKTISLTNCMKLSPLEVAEQSEIVTQAYSSILNTIEEIKDSRLRKAVQDIIVNPAPTIMTRYTKSNDKEMLRQKLVDSKLLNTNVSYDMIFPPYRNAGTAPQPFITAPGSGYGSHHSYPGGLATHTATNLKISLAVYQTYREVYGYDIDKDVVLASQALHDLHKPWVFQWKEDGSSLSEAAIAGTGAHHVLGVAESIFRGLPAEVVIAQACAHNHPGFSKDEAEVVGWIKAAGIIAGKDPVKAGLLDASGTSLPTPHKQEGYVTHLGDHDWVLSVPAAKVVINLLQKIGKAEYGMSDEDLNTQKFNSFRNYIGAQITMMNFHHLLSTGSEKAVAATVKSLIRMA